MNPKKIRRLMQKYNLFCPIRKANPYRRMAKALKTNHVAENLVDRQFEAHGPRTVLLTDITYIPYNGTFCYLSTIIDAYTKQVLSYVLSESLEVDFVLRTIELLVEGHGISLSAETMIHSDQGCHYTSYRFIQIVKDSGLRQSMSRRGNCWDNAPQESFFGHMKDELDDERPAWLCFEDVRDSVDRWMCIPPGSMRLICCCHFGKSAVRRLQYLRSSTCMRQSITERLRVIDHPTYK